MTFGDIMSMPYNYIQTAYYKAWQDALAKEKLVKDGGVPSDDAEEVIEELVDV